MAANGATLEPLWVPKNAGTTEMDRFREAVNEKFNLKLISYGDLYHWSVENCETFWEEYFNFSQIKCSAPYTQVMETKNFDAIPKWFEGAKLNYAENLLEHPGLPEDKVAVYIASESSPTRSLTFDQLRQKVKSFANALLHHDVQPGDRVCGFLTTSEESLIAYLATAAVGAIWSSTSPDFGATSVLERFQQIQPKVLIAVDVVYYNGKVLDQLAKLEDVYAGIPDLGTLILCTSELSNDEKVSKFLNLKPNAKELDSFLNADKVLSDSNRTFDYAQMPFYHPLCILYSSGTTGEPKCMAHSAGGTLLQHLKEHVLHGNTRSTDVVIFYTTTGWVVYNFLISALATGAAIVLYDGAPLMNRMWDLIDELDITIYLTSAKWIATNEQEGLSPNMTHKLSKLHTVLSTGSSLSPQSYRYIYNHVKKDVMLGSISGGSDIISSFMGQNVTLPVYEGEIQSRNLGMAVEFWDEDGKPVAGKEGELVCTKPFPCMPIYFWNDDGTKYKKAYFSKYPGVWCHGDFCVLNPVTGGIVMLGRSDGTLNPNGVRFGSAEIYNVLQSFPCFQDTLCVSQTNTKLDERVVLFVKMAASYEFSDSIVSNIKSAIREKLSPRHVPAVILPIEDIPYTINGKKVEIAVKMIIAGKEVHNSGSIFNSHSLELYKNIPILEAYRNS
ncbi:Acetoacetyl-CoA synthetase [Halotydeus destructor]|nr:Acetoacetyl-CoA synthetase [Halotydeus destructor]